MKNYLYIIIISCVLLFSLSAITAADSEDSILTESVVYENDNVQSEDDEVFSPDSSIEQSNDDNNKNIGKNYIKTNNADQNQSALNNLKVNSSNKDYENLGSSVKDDKNLSSSINDDKNLASSKKNNNNLTISNKVKKNALVVSNSKIISSSKANKFLNSNKAPTFSYRTLYNLIKSADSKKVFKLTQNCVYNPKTDSGFKTGVRITKSIVIDGGGHYIDGRGLVKCIRIRPNLNVTIKNFKIYSGYAKSRGAGIFLGEKSKLVLRNCVLRNNKVYNANGAAIYSNKGSALEIHSSFFKNNTCIRVSNLAWKKFKRGMGSAIKTTIGCSVKIYNSNFTQNKAYMSTILVVSYSEGKRKTSNLHIYKCIFENNTSYYSGVIYDDELGRATILNSVFRKNYSLKDSGIVSLDASLSSWVKYCVFQNNKGYNGGAITVRVFDNKYRSNVNIVNCQFIKNIAKTDGGAICAVYGKVHIRNSYFKSNYGKRYGGAIYTRQGTLNVSKSKFVGNKAKIGGVAYLQNKKAAFSRSVFSKNKATVRCKNVYSSKRVKYYKCKF